MAEFGTQATQLQGPQGMGANIVSPVQTMDTGRNPLYGVVSSIADTFAKGIQADNKELAAKQKAGIIGEYTGKIRRLTSGLEQGTVNAARVSVESKQLFSQYMANFPEYASELSAAAKSLTEFSSLSTAETEMREERDAEKRQLAAAEASGFITPPGASDALKADNIRAHALEVRAEKEFRVISSRFTHNQAVLTAEQAIQKRQDEDTASKLINDLAGSTVQNFGALARDLSDAVRKDPTRATEARASLGIRMSQIRASMLSVSKVNPALATPYQKIMDELEKVGMDMLDPAKRLEDTKNAYELLITKTMLIGASSSPAAAAAVAANRQFGNNPTLLLQTTKASIDAFSVMAQTPFTTTDAVPKVIGEAPELEKDALKLMKLSIEGLVGGKVEKSELAAMQTSQSTNHILKQIGSLAERGAIDPERTYGIVRGLAEPSFGKYAETGNLDKGAAQSAKKTVQIFWRKTGDDVMARLEKSPLSPTGEAPFIRGTQTRNPIQYKHMVDVTFDGSNVVFSPKTGKIGGPAQVQVQERTLGELKGAQILINQALRAGAHLDGTTDYKKYWEENKHEMFPALFQAPVKKAEAAPKFDLEKDLATTVAGTDTGAGMTRDVLASILVDLESGKLNPEQQKQLRKALEQMKD